MIPRMFICVGVFMALTNPVSSSHEEAVLKDLGVPLAGAICGAVLGLFLDRRIRAGQGDESATTANSRKT